MALRDSDKANFSTLQRAHNQGRLALIESRDKVTGEYRALICAMSEDDKKNFYPAPLAVMVWSNPYEQFEDPTQQDLSAERPGLLAAALHALNQVRNTKLNGCPGGFKNTYELAAALDKVLNQ